MNAAVAAVFTMVLVAGSVVAEQPKTVDDAVQVLKTQWLAPKDRDWILRNPKERVWAGLYMGFGTGLRNQFGLRGKNQALRDSCGSNNPEGCSSVIINRLWESVRKDADPALVSQLDCQFQLAHTIHVTLKGLNGMTTRYMVKQLQSQIDLQLTTLAASGATSCQRSLTLDVAGKPDMSCFVVAPHRKQDSKYWDDLPLEDALAGLGTRNGFRTIHYPPKITLDFGRRCQFPQPFPY